MTLPEKWIWLPKDSYSDYQITGYDTMSGEIPGKFAVAEFKKCYTFTKKTSSVHLRFSGDTNFKLYLNGEILATGPATPGGDFLCNGKQRPNFYAYEMTVHPDTEKLDFFAKVRKHPSQLCDFSKGRGGFMMSALITFDDGTKTVICTDSTWLARLNGAYTGSVQFDARISPDEFVNAEEIPDIWQVTTAPIPVRTETEIIPINGKTLIAEPHSESTHFLELDKIYAGFVKITARAKGDASAEVMCSETGENGSYECFATASDSTYTGFNIHSAGMMRVKLINESDYPAEFDVTFISTHYPVTTDVSTVTSDSELNDVLDVCKHTLKICRQTHHLDSPRHCEPLACTGDYYIESLMTAFSFGDMRLAEFDILRTAELIRNNGGRMFHTTYSLIWVKMMHDVYMFTGNKAVLQDCYDALIMLLDLFESYVGETGLIENPYDYMFVDWIYLDGISLHHPPKALGQTSLNMFYFLALDHAEKIFAYLDDKGMASSCERKKNALKDAVDTLLYDKEKEMYFEGLNTPSPKEYIGQFMPQNIDKRYYLKHSNILSVYSGLCDGERAKMLIEKVMSDEIDGDYQPYFAHYLLEAIYKSGLRDKYTLKVIEKWKQPVKDCKKGLAEGFVKPEPTYSFDHSHAWGGTPLYSLPKALTGFEILEPGLEKYTVNPSLLGLDSAHIKIPLKDGILNVKLEKNSEAQIFKTTD